MIQLNSAGKRYGHKLLFENADLLITSRDGVGLVGANGTGKSTLLKVLAGTETLDYGSVSVAKGWPHSQRENSFCGMHVRIRAPPEHGAGARAAHFQHGGT
jgi:ATPase subunit of ABC transporter with duplicated ATPase domains